MQKIFFSLALIALACTTLSAQDLPNYHQEAYRSQYPLTVNELVTTVLVFPAPIVQNGIDRGSGGIIAKQVDGVPNILKVKAATPDFASTNLTVITADGQIYSYSVSYSAKANDIPIDMGRERSKEEAVAFFKNRRLNETQTQQVSAQITEAKPFLNQPIEKSYGIRAKLGGIYIAEDVLFYRIDLKNATQIDYTLDFMRCYIRDRKRIRRSAEQEQELKPLQVYYQKGEVTSGRTSQAVVIAFPRFTVSDHKNFVLQLFEKNGDRNIVLKVDGKAIAKAKHIPFSITGQP